MNLDLTHDDFLSGKIKIWQPKVGYRAATDPVLLAAAVAAKPGQTVLELGCGVGTAIACLCRRVADINAHGLEIQDEYAELAKRNSDENNLGFSVHLGDLSRMPEPIRQMDFDEVFLNPPYFERASASAPNSIEKKTAHIEAEANLSDWIAAAKRRIRPRGYFTIIHRAERLHEILYALGTAFGDVRILPLTPRENSNATRVIVRARKGVRSPSHLVAPFVLHTGVAHTVDGENFTVRARSVLRDMAAIDM